MVPLGFDRLWAAYLLFLLLVPYPLTVSRFDAPVRRIATIVTSEAISITDDPFSQMVFSSAIFFLALNRVL